MRQKKLTKAQENKVAEANRRFCITRVEPNEIVVSDGILIDHVIGTFKHMYHAELFLNTVREHYCGTKP